MTIDIEGCSRSRKIDRDRGRSRSRRIWKGGKPKGYEFSKTHVDQALVGVEKGHKATLNLK